MRFSHATHLHIVTSFCLEIWRFLSEAINTRLAYVANYIKKFVAAATITLSRASLATRKPCNSRKTRPKFATSPLTVT